MIITEGSEPLENRDDTVFPIGIISSNEGVVITAYKELLYIAEELEKLDEGELFCDKTKARLTGEVFPMLEKYGYDCELSGTSVYSLDDRNKVDRKLIRDDTEPLMPDHKYENLTECEPDPFDEGYLCFGTVADNKILSAASENPHPQDSEVIDIGVETSENYEGKGYASSNVAALTYYLLDPGKRVTYIAEDGNVASRKVAEKVGFRRSSRELRVIGYKK